MPHDPRPGALSYLLAERFHRLAWAEWGDPHGPSVLCVHGLTRSGRDFDPLAQALAQDGFRVLCPDLPGRGGSEWLKPEQYTPASYLLALSHLLATLDGPVRWVGTSLGGICGMLAAATPGHALDRLVLNDIGPLIPAHGLRRIAAYLAAIPESFADLAEAETLVRSAPYGALTDAQWAHMAATFVRPGPAGRLSVHYDPAIAAPLTGAEPTDQDLWPIWAKIDIPRLVVRGADSDLLLPETLARMQSDGAAAHLVPDAGHAPALMDPPTIEAIRRFLAT